MENSYEVSKDDENPGHLYNNKRAWNECDATELFTITSRMALQQDSSLNMYAPDIRAFGLLVLEMLVAISQYKQKIQSGSRSRVSRLLEEVVRDATESEQPVDTSTPHDYHLHDDENCACNTRVVDVRVHNEQLMYQPSGQTEAWLSKYDGAQVERADSLDHADVEEASLIARRDTGAHVMSHSAQNDGTDLCLNCGQVRSLSSNGQLQSCRCLSLPQDMEQTEEETLCTSCQYDDVEESAERNKTPPKLSVRAFNVDKSKKQMKPRSQAQLPFSGEQHVVELPEIGESDTESVASIYRPYARRGSYSGKQILTNGSFLTPRTTPELRTPTSKSDSATATPTSINQDARSPVMSDSNTDSSDSKSLTKESESRQDPSLVIKVQEIGFQTIYEEDENQNGTMPNKNKPQIPPKPRKFFKPPLPIKRRPPPPLPRAEGTFSGQTEGKKRFSMASLDESVISAADSGLGSSHYESSYCGSEISSIYLQPGSRNTIYSGSVADGSETYCPVRPVPIGKKLGSSNRITDSGIESSADSCEELAAKRSRIQQGHLQQDSDTATYTSQGSSNTNTEHQTTENDEDSANNTYEQLPDIPDSPPVQPRRKEKQPCVGHHEHLENSPCKFKKPSPDIAEKTSATISTQTTDSLERPKSGRRKSGESVDGEWKTLVDKASSADESEYQAKLDNSEKLTNRGHSIQPYTVRQKTLVHQETVHSQPVVSQPATYPQKLQHPSHLPPKQIYTQSRSHYPPHYEMSPKGNSLHRSKYTVSSIENLYTQKQASGYHPMSPRSDIAEVHNATQDKGNSYNELDKYHTTLDHQYHADPNDLQEVDTSRNAQVSSSNRATYPTPWSDYRHNLAYYKIEHPNVHEGYRSAFHKPSPNQKYLVPPRSFGDGRHETDEEKISHVMENLNSEGKLGAVAGQVSKNKSKLY